VPSSVLSSALSTNWPDTTGTLSDSAPTSYSPIVSASSGAYVPPAQSSALPTGSSRSIDFSISLISPSPSLPITGTDAVSTTFPLSASGSSGNYSPPAQSSAQVTGPSSSDSVIVPRPSPSAPASMPGTLSDSVPTSFPSGAPSSNGYLPPNPSTTAIPVPTTGTNTDAVPTSGVTPSSGYGQSPVSSNTATDAIPTSGYSVSGVIPSGSAYSPSVTSNSATDAISSSRYPGSSVVLSGSNSPSSPSYTATDAVPTSGYPASSGYSGASPTGPVGTNTGSIPTSSDVGSVGPSSSGYTAPGSTALPTQVYPSGSVPSGSVPSGSVPSGSVPSESVPSGSLNTVSGTLPAVTSASSGLVYPELPFPASTTVVNGTTRITSRLTLTPTNYITLPLPTSSLITDTATDADSTSQGTGYVPSGSG
jgi:hypothetical protein